MAKYPLPRFGRGASPAPIDVIKASADQIAAAVEQSEAQIEDLIGRVERAQVELEAARQYRQAAMDAWHKLNNFIGAQP